MKKKASKAEMELRREQALAKRRYDRAWNLKNSKEFATMPSDRKKAINSRLRANRELYGGTLLKRERRNRKKSK